jgi:hypothetical protein
MDAIQAISLWNKFATSSEFRALCTYAGLDQINGNDAMICATPTEYIRICDGDEFKPAIRFLHEWLKPLEDASNQLCIYNRVEKFTKERAEQKI